MPAESPTQNYELPVGRSNGHEAAARSPNKSGLGVGLVRLARPWHWVKNVFVLLPIPFGLNEKAHGHLDIGDFLLGLGGFRLVNSAVYALNDAVDAAADRRHPTKRNRPVARGDVSAGLALIFGFTLLACGLAMSA